LILVGSVWDVARHRSLGREAFWIPPHLVLYSGVGLTGLVCAVVVVGATWGWTMPSGMDPRLVVRRGRKPPLGFVLAGCGVLGCVLAAPFDEWWHRMFGLDVTVWSPPHLVAVGAAGAIRLGGIVALAGEMPPATAESPRRQGQPSWAGMTCAEGVLLVLFSLFLGNLTFVLGGYEYWATWYDGLAYAVMASLVVPLVLVAGDHRVNRLGAATGIVLLLMLWQEPMRAALLITDYVLPSFLPLWPLYLVPALAVDAWSGLARRRPQAAWHDAVAGLLFAAGFVGMVYREVGSRSGMFWALDGLLLTALLAGITGAASGWAGAQLARCLPTASPAAGPRGLGAPTDTNPEASGQRLRRRSRSWP
jgi:hypothetical protein